MLRGNRVKFLCMEKATIRALFGLIKAMEMDSRFVLLRELEDKVNSDKEIQALHQEVKAAQEAYETSLKESLPGSAQTQEKQKALFLIKKKLDELPLSQEYTKAFSEVRLVSMYIDDCLFSSFRDKRACGENNG